MAILVTGGAGYIGSHTAKALAQAGLQPIVVDNLERGHREAVQWGPLIEADIGDRAAMERIFREHNIDAVLHFAAFAYVGESMHEPELYFRNNVVQSLSLLEAMHAAGVRTIVFSSTCATYGNPLRIPIDEDHPQNPVSPYGESKVMVERLLHWFGSIHGLRWAALRYFNAAGADPEGQLGEEHDPEPHLVPVAISAVMGRTKALEIYGTDYDTPDGTAVRDYLHVTDLGVAHVAALRYLQQGGPSTAFNLGTGRGQSVREVIAMVERVSGRKVPAREVGRRAGDPPALVADASKATRLLHWRAEHSTLEEIVRTAWSWKESRSAVGR
ncbi:MAG TPA: UDP-glucose 4-epimerase GalE [Bryobacteraceae bacterium]|nr:UDP-glucose 4-epimerase GalE [Bryobacteraceae bacterium]